MKLFQPIFSVLVAAGLVSLAGCSSEPSDGASVVSDSPSTSSLAAAKGNEPNYPEFYEIRIPDSYTPTGVYTPYIADAKGFYEEEGIKPVFTGVIGPGQHVAAVVAKDNDVGTLHVNRTINGIAAGAPIRAVVADSETSEAFPHMEYVVLSDGPLKTPTDIIDKNIGLNAVGGCNEYIPYGILKKLGIEEPQGTFEIVTVPSGNEELALRNGSIDVAGFHGHPLDVFNNGGVRVLFDDYDVWEAVGGATPWYFHEDFIRDNPEAVRRFVAAQSKTDKWINENREEAKRIQAERADIPVEKITIMNYTNDGIIKEDSVQIWIDILKGYGELTVDLAAKDIYTNEFNVNSQDYRF
ncbi:MAG: ABC transporter substrate-binding protein [Deltaproteobacteria bacterium]|jgi:ABC-type nitrate/sulfonate/bicarbonate transport system substrate-binding protein|nr:ABC transporter substrate-binding protein [Deltaproteobacteria bacterium]